MKTILKLDTIKFDAICIENMSGELLYDIQSRDDSAFIDLHESFGGNRLSLAKSAQEYYNIEFSDAQNKIAQLLLKETLVDTDHKLLMKYFTANT